MELSTGSISDPSGENYEGQAKNTFVQSTGFSENSVGGGGTASLTPWMTACSTVPKNALAPAPKELLAPEVKVVNTYHELHCHGQCMLKTHIRDGRILAITSAGDVPRCEASKTDKSIGKMQRRACMKGYAERKRVYAPDRLKYPLLQTIERGNLAGFKRISSGRSD